MSASPIEFTNHLAAKTGAEELQNWRMWQYTGSSGSGYEGSWWYNSTVGDKRIHFYDGTNDIKVPRLDRSEVVTGQYVFSPTVAQAPFALSSNGQGQLVTGLNADLVDGFNAVQTATADTLATRYTNGRLRVGDPSEVTDAVNLQTLTSTLSSASFSASQITSGLLALARGGTNKDLSAAATGAFLWKDADSFEATAALTGIVIGNGTSAPSALTSLTVALGGTGGTTEATARASLDVPWIDDVFGFDAARWTRGGLVFDGTSNNRLTGTAGVALALSDFSVFFIIRLRDYTPGVAMVLWSSHSTGNSRVSITLGTTGAFVVTFTDSGGTTTPYSLTPDSALMDGETYSVLISVDRDGLATLYINGDSDRNNNGTAVTVSVAASSSVNIGTANANVWVTGNAFLGELQALSVFNFAFTSSDVMTFIRRGLSASYSHQWGTMSIAYTGDFSAGVDSWSTDSSGVTRQITGNTDTIDGQDDWLKVETLSTVTCYAYRLASSVMATGKRYRISARIHNPSGSPFSFFAIGHTAGSYTMATLPTAGRAVTQIAAGTTTDVVHELTATQEGGILIQVVANSSAGLQTVASGNPFYVKNVTIQEVGAMLDLDLQYSNPAVSLIVKDRSAANNHGALASASHAGQTQAIRQMNLESLFVSGFSANNLLYSGTNNVVAGLAANSGSVRFLTQTSSAAPAWTDLFGGTNTWTGAQTFSGAIHVPTPTVGTHAATMDYVLGVAGSGLRPLVGGECATATTANITLSGEQTLDGVLTSTSRVLVKNQTAPEENGVYVSAAGAWSRSVDANTAGEITQGAYTFVSGGTTQAGTSWYQTSAVAALNTDPVTWIKFFQQAAYVEGTGIDITGLTLSIDLTAGLAWTGAHTFANTAGVNLNPYGTSAGETTSLRFKELAANGTNYVGFKAADTLAGSVIWVLPSADGSANYYVKTSGAGVLSFAQIASTEISNSSFVTSVGGTTDRITVAGTLTPTVDIASTYVGQASITTLGTITTGVWQGTLVGVVYGGTGFASYTVGDLLYADSTTTLAKRGIGTANRFLQSLSGVPNWSAYGLPASVAANDLLYASGSTAIAALSTVASRVLVTDGSGVISWGNTLPTGLTVAGDSSSGVGKMRWFNVGDGSLSTITLTHNYNTPDVAVVMYEVSSGKQIGGIAVIKTSVNAVQIEFLSAPTLNQYRAAVWAMI